MDNPIPPPFLTRVKPTPCRYSPAARAKKASTFRNYAPNRASSPSTPATPTPAPAPFRDLRGRRKRLVALPRLRYFRSGREQHLHRNAQLLIFGELPPKRKTWPSASFPASMSSCTRTCCTTSKAFHQRRPHGHPLAVVNSMGCYHPELFDIETDEESDSPRPSSYPKSAPSPPSPTASPWVCPSCTRPEPALLPQFPAHDVLPALQALRAARGGREGLVLFLIVHADHEQNCSCATVRMVGSTQTSLFASIAPAFALSGAPCTAAPTRASSACS